MKNRLFQPTVLTAKRQRSFTMAEKLPEMDAEGYLWIKGVRYLVVTQKVQENWLSGPLVSVGAHPESREFLICYPHEGQLKEWIQQFIQPNFKDMDEENLIKQVVQYIRSNMDISQAKLKEIDRIIETIKGDPEQCYTLQISKKEVPLLNILLLLNAKLGACRHANLLAAFLLQALVDAGLLPKGTIIYDRNVDSAIPHAVVHYETDTSYYTVDAVQPQMCAAIKVFNIVPTAPSSPAPDTQPVPEDESFTPTQPLSFSFGSQNGV